MTCPDHVTGESHLVVERTRAADRLAGSPKGGYGRNRSSSTRPPGYSPAGRVQGVHGLGGQVVDGDLLEPGVLGHPTGALLAPDGA